MSPDLISVLILLDIILTSGVIEHPVSNDSDYHTKE